MNLFGQKMNPKKALSTDVFESWNTIISNDEKARKEKKALKANKEKKDFKEKGQVKRKYSILQLTDLVPSEKVTGFYKILQLSIT